MACAGSGCQAQVAAVVGVHACRDQVLQPLAVAGVRGRQLHVGLQLIDLGDLHSIFAVPQGFVRLEAGSLTLLHISRRASVAYFSASETCTPSPPLRRLFDSCNLDSPQDPLYSGVQSSEMGSTASRCTVIIP